MYCLFQMASIKQELAMYTEAVEEYHHILDISPNYVPALKGLGETYNFIAKSYPTKYLHGRAREKCQGALTALLRTAAMRPDLSCLWKLAGESCTILHVLPSEDFRFEKSDKTTMNKLETPVWRKRGYGTISVGQLSAGYHDMRDNNNNALSSAQRAIYLHPENLSLGLKLWCHKQRTVCSVHANKHSEVLSSLEALVEDFGTEKHAQQFFEVFQNVMKGDVDNISTLAQTADLSYYWEIVVEMYLRSSLMQEAENGVQQYVTHFDNNKSVLKTMLIRLANSWYLKALETGNEGDMCKFDDVAKQILSIDKECSVILLMQGVLKMNRNTRLSRYQLQDVCKQEVDSHMTGSRKNSLSVARRALIYILRNSKKDAEMIEKLAMDAEQDGDIETMCYL